MRGLYLLAIVVSLTGITMLDWRFRLALFAAPARTIAAVAIGTAFFLVWDAVGIATGVFVKGDSPAFVGILLAPELPIEEPVFLAFFSYLAIVVWVAVQRMLARRRDRATTGTT
ncbi:MAG TPA: lycopene cyclase domain-containing protein [Microbacterium sp.]|uniref:lycopene cyclase domain-containing protein n=1 Tax=Microbacterium sp. TaxID=51671 RepID=UPI002BF3C1F9|nr:lycopene cyclase domain-containing protein [Microbacterium sp.]HWI30981.1 lycopene cyclase domain-containing protein [Microbacterium sp.]